MHELAGFNWNGFSGYVSSHQFTLGHLLYMAKKYGSPHEPISTIWIYLPPTQQSGSHSSGGSCCVMTLTEALNFAGPCSLSHVLLGCSLAASRCVTAWKNAFAARGICQHQSGAGISWVLWNPRWFGATRTVNHATTSMMHMMPRSSRRTQILGKSYHPCFSIGAPYLYNPNGIPSLKLTQPQVSQPPFFSGAMLVSGRVLYPIGSMYGIFAYIWLFFYGKCIINIPYMDPMGISLMVLLPSKAHH